MSANKVVPLEPTMGQWDDFCAVHHVPFDKFIAAYKAMLAGPELAAAPQAVSTDARKEALEEAAKVCEELKRLWMSGKLLSPISDFETCASAIRALKAEPPHARAEEVQTVREQNAAQTAWLIEFYVAPTILWFTGEFKKDHDDPRERPWFDPDVNKALQFNSRESAQECLTAMLAKRPRVMLGADCYRVTEHEWPAAAPSATTLTREQVEALRTVFTNLICSTYIHRETRHERVAQANALCNLALRSLATAQREKDKG